MRLVSAGSAVLLLAVLTLGCGVQAVREAVQDGVQQGTAEGAMSVLGRAAIEGAAGVTLAEDLACTSGEPADGGTPIECTGQTADGKKAAVKGTVASVDLATGFVKGDLTLVFDGKQLATMDCIGVC